MGESSAVAAQRLANEANLRITQDTNNMNWDIAQATNASNEAIQNAANDFNRESLELQNQWNIDQWNREIDYNTPAKQMQRYIEAGINPVFAAGSISGGNANPLTSASAAPAVTLPNQGAIMQPAHVMPEYDPNRPSNIIAAANNVSNSLQGFLKLSLEQQDVETRKRSEVSQTALQNAEAMLKKSQTVGQDIYNNLNNETFESLVGIKVAELDKLRSDISHTEKDSALLEAKTRNEEETTNQIIAMTNYMSNKADRELEQIRVAWANVAVANRQADIAQQNANINQQNADTNSFVAQSNDYYKGEELKMQGRQQTIELEKYKSQLELQSFDSILKSYEAEKGYLGRILGVFNRPLQNYLGITDIEGIDEHLRKIETIGTVLKGRLIDNPGDEALKSYSEYLKGLNDIPIPVTRLPQRNTLTNGFSIQNP